MIFNIIGLIIGILILGAGIYYLIKEKDDKESRKIYGITTCAGAVIVTFIVIRLAVQML